MSETAGRVVDAEKARAARTAASSGPWRADDEHGLMPGTKPAWVVSRTDESGEAYLGDLAYIPQDMAIPEGEPTPQEQADAATALGCLGAGYLARSLSLLGGRELPSWRHRWHCKQWSEEEEASKRGRDGQRGLRPLPIYSKRRPTGVSHDRR